MLLGLVCMECGENIVYRIVNNYYLDVEPCEKCIKEKKED